MDAHKSTIHDYLSTDPAIFIIPVYQRNYDWKEENCIQMFDDIKKCIETQKDHFLGTIFFKEEENKEEENKDISIIDGQQRITSIILMLKAMADYTSNEVIKQRIENDYIYSTYNEDKKIKLHLNKLDNLIYQKILNNVHETQFTITQKNAQIYKNYKLFSDLIKKYIEKDHGKINDLKNALRHLTIIGIKLENENPHEIFESLNSTGLSLQKVDLLRNYFLMQFSNEQQRILYDEYWVEIEQKIGVANMEQFFTEYLIYKRRSASITICGKKINITNKNLYIAFKHWYEEEYTSSITEDEKKQKLFEKTQELFADLKKLAGLYKEFIFDDIEINLKNESYIRQKFYYLLNVNKSSKASCLLLYFLDLYNENIIDDCILKESIEAVLSFSVRARLCKVKSIDYQFIAGILQKLKNRENALEFIDALWDALASGEGMSRFPSDEEFKTALTQSNLDQTIKSTGIKYLLYALEEASKSADKLPDYNDNSISIEHIIPETLTPQWQKSLPPEEIKKCEHYVHNLGNLALIDSNEKTSKKTFAEKQEIYKQSNYYYTQKLAKIPQYSISSIEQRGLELAQRALIIWNLPQKPEFQAKKYEYRAIYSLKDDFKFFTGKKPDMLYIGLKTYSIKFWKDIIPYICNEMIEENRSAFLEIAKSKICNALVFEDDENQYSNDTSYKNIIDNIYIRLWYSTDYILKICKNLLETFDQMTGSELFDSMAFTLKDN